MPNSIEINVQSWEALRKQLSAMGDALWYFRGQTNSTWSLKPTLERAVITYQEEALYDEFKRTAHLYSQDTQRVDSKMEWLALMQHHGAPTRLLDWTRSAYVAAFFAVNELTVSTQSAAVWAINVSEIYHIVRKRFDKDKRFKPVLTNQYFRYNTLSDEDFTGIFLSEWFEDEAFKFPSVVLPIMPYYNNPRLMIQQGVFLSQTRLFKEDGVTLLPFEDALRETLGQEFDPSWILKCVIPTEYRLDILRELNAMNINDATLFPGLDGFARYLAKKVSMLTEELKP
ncbi:MAG: FRG domain-containing protein [Saprospiraceae bacterium]